MVKIKLFLADTKSYVSLDLNKNSQGHPFVQIDKRTVIGKCYFKEELDMGCIRFRWDDIRIILNEKEIHLPTMLIIPLIHKLKVRKLFGKRDLMHVYIMLKQRKSWYNLEGERELDSPTR